MGRIIKIDNSVISESLEGVSRQYLAGNLKRPQKLDFIRDDRLEIGITDYNGYATEPVHYHTEATEYQYMVSGWTQYMDTETGEVYEFRQGDFYCIERNTTYAQKSKKGTRILFIKVPSINDKQVIETTDIVEKWYAEGLKTVRKDYSHDYDMPSANSVRPAAAVAIVSNDRILMLKRRDNEKWTLPGGTMELTESLLDCAVREVKEETGLNIAVKDVIGTYTDPDVRISYSDGEVRREFTVVYYGTVASDRVDIDEESSEYKWIPLSDVDNYPMAPSQQRRLADVICFIRTGEKKIG